MITYADMLNIYKKVRSMNAKAFFILKGTKYKLAINRYIHAIDEESKRVPWGKAFGPKLPHDVLNTFPVLEIKLLKDNEVITFKNIAEFLKWIR